MLVHRGSLLLKMSALNKGHERLGLLDPPSYNPIGNGATDCGPAVTRVCTSTLGVVDEVIFKIRTASDVATDISALLAAYLVSRLALEFGYSCDNEGSMSKSSKSFKLKMV
jgi:hypothetical protein